jgi:hypothetical protein
MEENGMAPQAAGGPTGPGGPSEKGASRRGACATGHQSAEGA